MNIFYNKMNSSNESGAVDFGNRLPHQTTSDYVEIVYLSVVFVLGVPLNAYTLVNIFRRYQNKKTRLLLLSLHLTVADLMILFFFALSKISWLITYRWLGGDALCKAVKFAQTFSFTLSSNVIICISVDRLLSLVRPLQVAVNASKVCKLMLAVAWVAAIVSCSPQWLTWTVLQITPQWAQCLDIWTVQMYQNQTSFWSTPYLRQIYNGFHVITVFWLPFAIVLFCYMFILKTVRSNLDGLSELACRTVSITSVELQSPKSSRTLVRLKSKNGSESFGLSQRTLLRRSGGGANWRRTKYRTLKTTLLILAAYVFCWLPYNSMTVWSFLHPESYSVVAKYIRFLAGLMVVNAMINPLIYSHFTPNLLRQLKNLWA